MGTYTLELSGYDVHIGQLLEVKLKDVAGVTLRSFASTVPPTGALTIRFENALEPGKSYTANWYGDLDNSGAYSPPTGNPPTFRDHPWRRAVRGDAAGVTQRHVHDQNWVDLSPF
jgi:hypothetical protein